MSIRSSRLGSRARRRARRGRADADRASRHRGQVRRDQSGHPHGIVTDVDWKNPHVHILINVKTGNDVINWAVELESPIALQQSGWGSDTVQVGDTLTVQGISARNGSKQAWARSVVMSKTGRQILMVRNTMPPAPLQPRPTPRGADGKPRLGAAPGGVLGYWAYPSSTVLVEKNASIPMDASGLLKNVADADKVAPLQPWSLALYRARQRRFLQDDPTYLNCKPPGGPRQFQQPEGVQFVEDPIRQRMFLLLGGGNSNYRILWMDGRGHKGQVGGDDDNPLYYGRAVAQWEGDTLVVDTRGFNEDFWFTNGGLPHTEQLRLVERFTRSDFDTLRYEGADRGRGRLHAAVVNGLDDALGCGSGITQAFLSGQ
jgi:hypothetical protein